MKKFSALAAVSLALLFLELLLIRLIGTEIRIFAYYSNLLLLGIFVGSGVGMFIKKRMPVGISAVLLLAIMAILIFGWFVNITDSLAPLSESFLWFQITGISLTRVIGGLFLTLFLFFLTMGVFIPLGQILGELLEDTSRIILVYSINVAASLTGMWLFQGMSLLSFSMYLGIIFAELLFLWLADNKFQRYLVLGCLALCLGLLGVNYFQTENPTVWSPYQKLTLVPVPGTEVQRPGYMLQVNNVQYMRLLDLSDAYKADLKEKLKGTKLPPNISLDFGDQYALPFQLKPGSQSALIIGAGGGNDAAAAVRAGVGQIDAVEIDPQIVEFGNKFHPENPYNAPGVTVVNDDGRSFFKRTDKKYDLIIYGLADSHTLTNSLTNVRLDHYLYTEESFAEAKKLLKPGGLLFLSFDVRRDWIGGHIEQSLAGVFGAKPTIFDMQDASFFGLGGVIFVSGSEPNTLPTLLDKNPALKSFIEPRRIDYGDNFRPLTDDWPYLYLDRPRLPMVHVWISLFLLLLLAVFLRGFVPWQGHFSLDFFFLGAGFLLFEFQNISKTSLLFGNTWTTNLFTITFVLIFILLANLIQAKKPIPLKAAYVGLVVSLLLQFFVPLSALNSWSVFNKAVFGSLFLNLPFFFSGTVFIQKLNATKFKSAAFASNLLGSAVGGMLEMFAFLWGIESLLFFSLGLYLLSWLSPVLFAKWRLKI